MAAYPVLGLHGGLFKVLAYKPLVRFVKLYALLSFENE
jgi:hypothetical protein